MNRVKRRISGTKNAYMKYNKLSCLKHGSNSQCMRQSSRINIKKFLCTSYCPKIAIPFGWYYY